MDAPEPIVQHDGPTRKNVPISSTNSNNLAHIDNRVNNFMEVSKEPVPGERGAPEGMQQSNSNMHQKGMQPQPNRIGPASNTNRVTQKSTSGNPPYPGGPQPQPWMGSGQPPPH